MAKIEKISREILVAAEGAIRSLYSVTSVCTAAFSDQSSVFSVISNIDFDAGIVQENLRYFQSSAIVRYPYFVLSDARQHYLFSQNLGSSRIETKVANISREIGKNFNFKFTFFNWSTQQSTDYLLKFYAFRDLLSSHSINSDFKALPTIVSGKWIDLQTDKSNSPNRSIAIQGNNLNLQDISLNSLTKTQSDFRRRLKGTVKDFVQ